MPPETEDNIPDERERQIAAALDEIDHILHHMQMLSELSASDMDVNRPLLQRQIELLKKKIDTIADQM